MKKFILLLIFCIGLFSISAQTVVLPTLADGQTQRIVTTDYVITNTTPRIFTLAATQDWATTQVFAIKMDTVDAGQTQRIVATDYVITNTTPRIFTLAATQDWSTIQVFAIKMDTVDAGQTNVAVQLFGRETSLTAYTQIGSTVNWKLTTIDTTITIINATASQDQQYKVVLTGTGTGISRVIDMEIKLNY